MPKFRLKFLDLASNTVQEVIEELPDGGGWPNITSGVVGVAAGTGPILSMEVVQVNTDTPIPVTFIQIPS